MNIKSKLDFIKALPSDWTNYKLLSALVDEAVKRYGPLDDDNFWQHRDFLRLNWGGAEGVLCDAKWGPVPHTGITDHFLHYSQSANSEGEEMVAYTSTADNGRADIQTRTTLKRYQRIYGTHDINEDLMPTENNSLGSANGPKEKEEYLDNPREKHNGADELMQMLRTAIAVGEAAEKADEIAHDKMIAKAVCTALEILGAIVSSKRN